MIQSLPKFAFAAAVVFSLGAAPAVFAEDAMAPATGAMAPATDAMAPAGGAMAPAGGAMAPAGGAMAPATGAMAPATGAMAPMSDAELKTCLDHAATVTPADAMKTATEACHTAHNGAMGTDAMAPKK